MKYGEDSIKTELEGCKRNKQIFEKIARELKAAGYERMAVQCREKIKKLIAEYKKVKITTMRQGRDRKTFVYFNRLDDLLGHRPATQPQHFLDTSADLVEKSAKEPTPLLATSLQMKRTAVFRFPVQLEQGAGQAACH